MNRNEALAVVAALVVSALPLASAQAPAAPQTPPASAAAVPPPASAAAVPPPAATPTPPLSSDLRPSNRARYEASGDVDARYCLDLATNAEIIACAEKYRSHRIKK